MGVGTSWLAQRMNEPGMRAYNRAASPWDDHHDDPFRDPDSL